MNDSKTRARLVRPVDIIMYRLMRAIFCLSLLNAAAAFTPSQVRSPRRHAV